MSVSSASQKRTQSLAESPTSNGYRRIARPDYRRLDATGIVRRGSDQRPPRQRQARRTPDHRAHIVPRCANATGRPPRRSQRDLCQAGSLATHRSLDTGCPGDDRSRHGRLTLNRLPKSAQTAKLPLPLTELVMPRAVRSAIIQCSMPKGYDPSFTDGVVPTKADMIEKHLGLMTAADRGRRSAASRRSSTARTSAPSRT